MGEVLILKNKSKITLLRKRNFFYIKLQIDKIKKQEQDTLQMSPEPNQISSKTVIVKINAEKIPGIKIQLKRLQSSLRDLQLNSVRVGRLGDDVVLSFNINSRYYNSVMQKLETSGAVSIVKEKGKTSEKRNYLASTFSGGKSPNPVPETNTPSGNSAESVDKMISSGDYEKIIQVSRNIKNGFELMKKAKENIDQAVAKSIELAYSKALKNKLYVDENINELIKISTNKELRILHKIDLMTDAGMKAVGLCDEPYDNINTLIGIANNNFIPNIVAVKAAVKFSQLVLDDPESHNDEIRYAIRFLNTRWVLIARDIVINKLSEQDQSSLNKLLDYIDSAR